MKAAEYHAVADQMRYPMAVASYRAMAETYERLAGHYEQFVAEFRPESRPTPAAMREDSRRCREAARRTSDLDEKRALASRALALAMLAEKIEDGNAPGDTG